MKKAQIIILLLSLCSYSIGQDSVAFKMADFIGVNTNVASYDQKYIDDLARCTKWIREYHSWGHYEVADNYYRWDNITKHPYTYTWPDHNKFMNECKRLGINVLIDVLNKPSWAGSHRGAYSTGDGTKPEDYLDKLEFMGQLVARYGAQKIDENKLETTDKISGLNLIKYYEDDNEPDYWWETPTWSAEKYAVYCNAVHDGYGVEPSDDYPLLGIKSVDSSAIHVLGGLTAENTNYIQKILDNSEGRIPFDVINVHTYCKDDKDGYSPENEKYGIEKNLTKFFEWRDKNTPGIPIWLTEFGWDTHINGNYHSYIYAPHEQQANYILRSFFVCLKMGFEKAFMFMGRDPNSKSTTQYSSSGLLYDKEHGLAQKPSYYYLSTMQKRLGNATLNQILSYREMINNNEVYCFEFKNENKEFIYAMWTREKDSKTDNGTKLNYTLNLDYQPEYCYTIKPKDKNLYGEKSDINTTGNKIELELSETPQFIFVSEKATSLNQRKLDDIELNVFPNPASKLINVSFNNPVSQTLQISLLNNLGKKLDTISESHFLKGRNNIRFNKNISPGIYFICLSTDNTVQTKKVIIL